MKNVATANEPRKISWEFASFPELIVVPKSETALRRICFVTVNQFTLSPGIPPQFVRSLRTADSSCLASLARRNDKPSLRRSFGGVGAYFCRVYFRGYMGFSD